MKDLIVRGKLISHVDSRQVGVVLCSKDKAVSAKLVTMGDLQGLIRDGRVAMFEPMGMGQTYSITKQDIRSERVRATLRTFDRYLSGLPTFWGEGVHMMNSHQQEAGLALSVDAVAEDRGVIVMLCTILANREIFRSELTRISRETGYKTNRLAGNMSRIIGRAEDIISALHEIVPSGSCDLCYETAIHLGNAGYELIEKGLAKPSRLVNTEQEYVGQYLYNLQRGQRGSFWGK